MDVQMEDPTNGEDIESESDAEESDNEEELEALAQALENQIVDNIFSYQSHVDLIQVLKQLADLDRLRHARNRMADQFPLTSELWLDWVEDEIKIASTTEEKAEILKIFERAIKDYLSVEIWLKYLEFAAEYYGCEEDAGIAEVRKLYESALTAAGLHVTKGSLLWLSYIEFEQLRAKGLQSNADAYLKQLKVVANIYKRMLSCPLTELEENYQKFTAWLNEVPEDLRVKVIDKKIVEGIYKKSLEKLLKINVYEDALISDPDHSVDHYKDYLDYEKSKSGSPVRVQFLYERMICDFCLHEEIWLDYINFVSTVLNNSTFVMEILKRALRNCPWSSELYQCQMRTLEKYRSSHESITGAFEQAVASGLQKPEDFRDVWMCYLEYLRRRFDEPEITKEVEERRLEELRSNFAKANEFLAQLENADPQYVVTQYWARIEAIYCKNMEKSRLLWNDILSVDGNRTAEMWLEYINLERAFGDSKHLRKLMARALQNTKDFPEKIAKHWIDFERDEGTLESFDNCLEKIKVKLNMMKEQKEREAQQLMEMEAAREARPKKSKRAGMGFKEGKEQFRKDAEPEKVKITGYKRKQQDEVEETDASPQKKSKKEENEELVKKLLEESEKSHGVTVVHDSSKDNRTVFVSNLDFSTEESVIREVFVPCGQITDLRLVKDYKGRSKGYCYVEFSKSSEAAAALKKDRELIEGRPMFVSKCDPDKETRGSGFKYSSNMEKNKLFVRGLPYTTSEDDLRELFGKYGPLKDVRLVTYRNGHSKGLAYVDFEDEVSAAQAIIKADGMTVGDRQISVAISNPPDRKSEVSKPVASLGGGPKDTGPRGRSRTQISFLPRSLQINQSQPLPSVANLSIESPQPTIAKKLNNSDFRNLLSQGEK